MQMNVLPLDMIRVIASYATMQELALLRIASRDFDQADIQRQKRFAWCKANIRDSFVNITSGKCVDCMCQKLKAVCITIGNGDSEDPSVQILSNYCSQHAQQYLNMGLDDLVETTNRLNYT